MRKNTKFTLALSLVLLFSTVGSQAQSAWKWVRSDLNYEPVVIENDTLRDPPLEELSDSWWTVFGYEKLTELENLALEGNFDILILENRVEEARQSVRIAKSSLFPALSLNPSYVRQELSANRPLGFEVDLEPVRINSFTVPVDLNYEVDILGKINNNVQASRFDLKATEARREDVILAITSDIARNFFNLITIDTENVILENTLDTRQESLDIVQARYDAGLVNQIDLQRAKTEYASVKVQLRNNQLLRTEIELALAILCGQEIQSFRVEDMELEFLPPVITPKGQESLVSDRPDLQEINFQLQAAEASLKVDKKELYPSFLLQGSFGYLSGESSEIFERDSRSWLIGGTVAVPIFEGFRRRANLDIAEQRLEASKKIFDQQQLVANQEVERSLSNILRLKEQLEAQQDFQLAAQQSAELSKTRYLKGLVTYLEVVDAERIYLDAERLSVQLLGRQLVNTVSLIQSMGY